MRYVTANGKVVNRIELDAGATWQPPAGEVLEPEDYTPPVEPEPPAVADPMVAKRISLCRCHNPRDEARHPRGSRRPG